MLCIVPGHAGAFDPFSERFYYFKVRDPGAIFSTLDRLVVCSWFSFVSLGESHDLRREVLYFSYSESLYREKTIAYLRQAHLVYTIDPGKLSLTILNTC